MFDPYSEGLCCYCLLFISLPVDNVLSVRSNDRFSRWIWVSQYQNVSILDFMELRMMEMVTTAAIRRAKLQSICLHQQANTQLFTVLMSFLSPIQQCRSTEGTVVINVINCY